MQLSSRTFSIASFVCNQSSDVFRIDQELSEQLTIGRAFRIRPLLPCLEQPDKYVVLTLSQHRVALFARSKTGLKQVAGVVPTSFDAIEAALTVEPKTQVRSAAIGGRGRQGVVYHGQGSAHDAEKVDLENYLKHVDNSINSYLQAQSGTRLILAGVDSITALFRAHSHCNEIADSTISGNVDHLSEEELQVRVEAIASEELHQQRKLKESKIREHDVRTATDPEQVLTAAFEGRIDSLFIDRDATLYGIFFADQRTLKEVHHPPSGDPGDASHDLLELAAVLTIKSGGTVYAVPASEMANRQKHGSWATILINS